MRKAFSRLRAAFSNPSYDYSQLIDRRFVLTGMGENQKFESHLPRTGVARRQVALEDWGDDWLVFEFDRPMEFYDPPFSYCLVRARWRGRPIGTVPCSVFVLTDPKGSLAAKLTWSKADFDFVTWGEIKPIV